MSGMRFFGGGFGDVVKVFWRECGGREYLVHKMEIGTWDMES